VSEKIIITHTKEVPIYFYNTQSDSYTLAYPAKACITIALSPSALLSLPANTIKVHIDAHALSKEHTVLTKYHNAIVVPKGIKIVHCNPIIIHRLEKNTPS
jgi:hypothetical protein